jgi:hypothetical protein
VALRVLTRSAYGSLVTLAVAKSHLGVSGVTEDAAIAALLERVRGLFEGELGRPLLRQRYLEALPVTSRHRVALSAYPIDAHQVTAEAYGDTLEADAIDPAAGILYRNAGWSGGTAGPEEAEPELEVTYHGGWLPPDAVRTWATGLTLAAGAWLRPTSPALSPWLFEVTTAGATGAGPAEPTWPTTAGATVTAGTAVLTARDAVEVPPGVQAVALYVTGLLYAAGKREAGLTSLSADGFSASWSASVAAAAGLPEEARRALDPWRHVA